MRGPVGTSQLLPLIAQALKVRSCLIDGEAVACDAPCGSRRSISVIPVTDLRLGYWGCCDSDCSGWLDY
jgi:hypothetical protein